MPEQTVDPDAPRLAPPGAGVPAYQRWFGRYVLLPLWYATLSPEGVPAAMERQGARLIALSAGLPASQLVRRVLVPPQIGLEDSSRFHSWAMILEHLTISGNGIAAILLELTHGRVPPAAVRVASLKPAGGLDANQAAAAYQAMLRHFRDVVLARAGTWDAGVRHIHPWFGPLGARQWACFAPFHQAIHLKQARRVRALLDSPLDRAGGVLLS